MVSYQNHRTNLVRMFIRDFANNQESLHAYSFLSAHSIFTALSVTMTAQGGQNVKQKYHLALDDAERRLLIGSLNDLRSRIIKEGKYTDAVDEVLLKIIGAKRKKFKIIYTG